MAKILIIFFITSIQCIYANVFSVDQYLDFLSTKHNQPKILKSRHKESIYQYNAATGITDWAINTSVYNSKIQPNITSQFTPSEIKTFGTTFSLQRPILSSGGLFSFDFTSQREIQPNVSFFNNSINNPIFFENAFSLSYRQPLLSGFLGDILKLPLTIASTNVKTSDLQLTEDYEQFILNELYIYIDWALAYEVTELSFARLQLARQSLNQVKKRVQFNLSEKIDLLRADFSLKQAHQQWLTKKSTLKSSQYKIASRFDDKSINSSIPDYKLYDIAYVKKPSYVVVDHLRLVKLQSLNKPVLNDQIKVHQQKRNGSLDLVGTYSVHNGHERFNNSLKLRNYDSTILLNYSRPLHDTESIETIKQLTERSKQLDYSERQIIINLTAEILSLHTLISEYKDILSLSLNQIIVAQKKADSEEALYKQGRSSFDLVIKAQDNVLDSKLNYANQSTIYQKYVLAYLELTDQLLDKYHLSL